MSSARPVPLTDGSSPIPRRPSRRWLPVAGLALATGAIVVAVVIGVPGA
jgi:hypothetical protein